MTRGVEWYRELLDATSDVIIVLDESGEIRYVNRAITDVLGYEPDRLRGRSAFDFVHEDDLQTATEGFAAFTDGANGIRSGEDADGTDSGEESDSSDGDDATRTNPTIRVQHADGYWCHVESASRSRLETPEYEGYVVSLREVSERHRRRQELATYEMIVETAPVGMFTLDESGVITMANDLYAETLDVPKDELVGMEFNELVDRGYYPEHVPETYEDHVRELVTSTNDVQQVSYSVEVSLGGDETLVHEAYMGLLPMENGEFSGTVIAFRDATKERAYERELERQNERLDAFASMVSHDLRNPLAVARGRAQLARETGDLSHLDAVDDAHDRMEALIDGLLTLARDGETVDEPESVELDRIARAAWQSVETGDAELLVEDSLSVGADPSRLRQLLENLFRNAVEHGSTSAGSQSRQDAVEHGSTSPGSQAHQDAVEHGAVTDEPLTVTVGTLADGEGFYVADDGRGISPEDREHVFEHGFSTHENGTGFGLEIVTTIADAHGWTVSLADGTDGARFDVETGEA